MANSDGPEDFEKRIAAALEIAEHNGCTDGAHHKQWVIAEMVKALTGYGYDEWVRKHNDGSEGPNTYEWDEGVPP